MRTMRVIYLRPFTQSRNHHGVVLIMAQRRCESIVRAGNEKSTPERFPLHERHAGRGRGCFRAQRRDPLFDRAIEKRAGRFRLRLAYEACARCFSNTFTMMPQPCSLAANAFARRASGIRSKPDSVTVSMMPFGASSSVKTMSVVGSPE
jgi:hypothetical protein